MSTVANATALVRPLPTEPDNDFGTSLVQAQKRPGSPAPTDSVAPTAPLVAQAPSSSNPLAPGAYVLGVGTGPAVPPGWRGGAFMLIPPGNSPFDFTDSDGTPSNTIFVSKNVVSGIPIGNPADPIAKLSHGAVGTYNPATREIQPGYGGTFVGNVAGTPVLAFVNTRGTVNGDFTGTVSGNFGIAFSMDQAAAGALGATAGLARTIPHPKVQAAAAGLQAGHDFLRGVGQAANAWGGVGYRVELRFEKGDLKGIYYNGRQITDMQQFVKDAISQERYRPPVIPNNGVPEIANFNSTLQTAFGTSPWDLAAVSGGSNHGNSVVGIANAWRGTIQAYGQRYYDRLPSDVQSIVIRGPQSMSDAGRAVNAILDVASRGDAGQILDTLRNRYDLDFGVPGVKMVNGINLGLTQTLRPEDYDFVRNAFEGDYRYSRDNPPPPPARRPGL